MELFCCTPSCAEAPFLSELATTSDQHRELNLYPLFGSTDGRLNVEKIEAAAGPLAPETRVFLCGPPGMVENLALGLRRRGLTQDHVHAEHFAFR